MRRLLLLTTFVFAACAAGAERAADSAATRASADSTARRQAAPALDPIALIRARYDTIEREAPTYRTLTRDVQEMSAEGGEVTAFFAAEGPRKLAAKFYGEGGRVEETYYLWGGRLIFLHEIDESYDRPLSGTVVQRVEDRFYFDGDSLIRWIDSTGRQGDVRSEHARELVRNARTTLDTLMKVLSDTTGRTEGM